MDRHCSFFAKGISFTLMLIVIIGLSLIIKQTLFPAALPSHPSIFSDMMISNNTDEQLLKPIPINLAEKVPQQNPKWQMEHFHRLDPSLDTRTYPPRICMLCHGNYPHRKNQPTRSLNNMHTSFLACEVCHIKPATNNLHYYWFDAISEKRISLPKRFKEKNLISNGLYNALIVPCLKTEGGQIHRLDRPVDEESLKEYFILWMNYTYDQKSRAKMEIHKRLSRSPVICIDCHVSKQLFLNFTDLGYTKEARDKLTGQELSDIVLKYNPQEKPDLFSDPSRSQSTNIQGTMTINTIF